jgi:hypothetical protein
MVIPINHHLSKEVLVFFLLPALFIHHPPLVSGKVLKKNLYISYTFFGRFYRKSSFVYSWF